MPLYELLMNHVMQVAVASGGKSEPYRLFPASVIQPVGFAPHQNLFPYPRQSFPGYGLLTEYFAFPWKFLFFDLCDFVADSRFDSDSEIDIYFFLDRDAPDLEANIRADTFRLGCSPIVNLFSARSEPIQVRGEASEYPVICDSRNPLGNEIYRVERVRTASSDADAVEYAPLYASAAVRQPERHAHSYWVAQRRQGRHPRTGHTLKGSDVYLSLVDRDLQLASNENVTLMATTTCLNRDVPGNLTNPQAVVTGGGPFRQVEIWSGPTATIRPFRPKRSYWSLISHLSLNHLSLGDTINQHGESDGQGGDALRGILELYNFGEDRAQRQKIQGLAGVSRASCVDRLPSAPSGFARGVEVTLEFDEEQFRDPGQGLFLFATVLEKFLAMYCSINSFTRTVAKTKREGRTIKKWPPNTGDQFLL